MAYCHARTFLSGIHFDDGRVMPIESMDSRHAARHAGMTRKTDRAAKINRI